MMKKMIMVMDLGWNTKTIANACISVHVCVHGWMEKATIWKKPEKINSERQGERFECAIDEL